MDEWVDGWICGWTDGWMDGWTDGLGVCLPCGEVLPDRTDRPTAS